MAEAPDHHHSYSSSDNHHDDDHDLAFKNRKALQFIEDVTTHADEVQRRVLAEILSRNSDTEYLKRHRLNGRFDQETFKKVIPVVVYEDLKPDIDRIANGDTSPILCSQPVSKFSTSSGTSGGESKLIPTMEEELERRSVFSSLVMPVVDQYVPNLDKGKAMYFLFVSSDQSKTPGGLPACPALTNLFKSKRFKDRSDNPYKNYTSPNETILCLDSYQSMYTQLLCGLCQNEQVLRVGANFASGFIKAIKFLEKHWRILCHDIRSGIINATITDFSVREAVMKILRPNPKLADLIEGECSKDSWKGIIVRLWPNTKLIDVIVTGGMAQYISTLDYYGNGLPLVCTVYTSSESWFGLNLNPLCKPSEVSYTFLPTAAYFEFLPVNRRNEFSDFAPELTPVEEKNDKKLVDLVDVQLGQEYEVVVTTYSGLYRYRVGDIVKVAGFKNKAPQFNFVCRKNVILSIDSDKTDEVELQNAVKNAASHLSPFDASLIDYTSYADISTIPGHYVLYWEISPNIESPIPASVFENCCLTIEESLNSVYRQFRVSNKSIGPLEIKVVDNGTFDKLMEFAISQSRASISQYKTPRCVKFAPIVQLLNSRVVSSYFSTKYPEWAPGQKQWFKENE